MRGFVSLGWLALVVAGCAQNQTQAQREAARQITAVYDGDRAYRQCRQQIAPALSQYEAVRQKLPRGGDNSITLDMKADESVPTPAEVVDLVEVYRITAPCNGVLLQAAAEADPEMAAILAPSYAAMDNEYLRLVRRQVSFGQYAQAHERISNQLRSDLARQEADSRARLESAHNAERQQQQAASTAVLAQWDAQQRAIYQQSPRPGRPIITNCGYVGQYLNCTTY